MRRYLFSTFLIAFVPVVSHAQNYIPSNGYSGAGVVVNMDVLNESAPTSNSMPVMSQNLQPAMAPEAPIVLRRPQPRVSQHVSIPASPPTPMVSSIPAPVAPPVTPPPAPVESDNYSPPPAPTIMPKRQALGSVHDTATDEAPAVLPAPAPPIQSAPPVDEMAPISPALPSPVMGKPDETLKPAAVSDNAVPAAPIADAAKDNFEAYRLFFDPSSDVLKPSETAVLDKIIAKLTSDPSLRLQVRAYANGTPDNAGAARRLSLTRALKVRDYVIQKNIAATRLDIRALGSGSAEMGDQVGNGKAPPDRVDVIFSK